MQSPLALNVLEDELETCAAFCRQEGLGIEITAFAFPTGLDQGFSERIQRHATVVQGLPCSLHGPFLDLYPTSPDPAVVDVCKSRHSKALQAAREVGASIYVAHLNSIPLIRNKNYRDRFAQAAADLQAECE